MQVSTPAPARKSHRNLSVLLVEDSRLLAERLRETILNVPGVQRVGSVDMSQYAPQLSSTINLVAASLGISIVPRSMQGLQPQVAACVGLRATGLTNRVDKELHRVLRQSKRDGKTGQTVAGQTFFTQGAKSS